MPMPNNITYLVKPAQLAESIFSTLTFHKSAIPATQDKPASFK